ncbi:MAG: M16 family metallopeptidase, partial [Fidelibacterota bacterium]
EKLAGEKEYEGSNRIVKKLENGLELIVDQNPDSKIFAAHILFKNRSLMEPEGKDGISSFVHRLLLKGTANMSEEDLLDSLHSISARVKVVDNPYIPYDDRYTKNYFSYLRFETVDEYYAAGLNLLSQIVNDQGFSTQAVEDVRKEMLNLLEIEEESLKQTGRRLFNYYLFKDHPFSKSVMGTDSTILKISLEDVNEFYKIYFNPANIILSIVTNIPADSILEHVEQIWVRKSDFQTWEPEDYLLQRTAGKKTHTVELGKMQSYIYYGYIFPVKEEDKLPLILTVQMLGSDISFRIREKLGMAYSVQADIDFWRDKGWITVSLGTQKENVEKVRREIRMVFSDFSGKRINAEDLNRQKNALKGRELMRRLSRINQAYYLGLIYFLSGDTGYYDRFFSEIDEIGIEKVYEVRERYIQQDNYVEVIVR